MKMYCPKCGSGSSFNMTTPKFCQECGESFSGTASKQPIKKRKTIAKKIEQVAPEVEKKETIPENINKLEFDTVGTLQVKGTTLGQVVGTSEGDEIYKRGESSDVNLSKEEFLRQFKKEAGTSRPVTDG